MRTLLVLSSLALAAASHAVANYTLTTADFSYTVDLHTATAPTGPTTYYTGLSDLRGNFQQEILLGVGFEPNGRLNGSGPSSLITLAPPGDAPRPFVIFAFAPEAFTTNGTYTSTTAFGSQVPTPGTATLTVQGVPEPTTMATLALGGLAVLRRRRR